MDSIFEKLKGCVRVKIFGAFPECILNEAAMYAVPLWGVSCEDENTVILSVYECDLNMLQQITREKMCEIEVLNTSGGSRTKGRIKGRLLLIVFLVITAASLCLSSLYIWEIDIVGNTELSDSEILRALSQCGVEIGTFWPGVSSDMVRSQMVELLPEIGWMTVNVNGSRAVVLITERLPKPEIYDSTKPVDIIASRTGIIERISVFNGRQKAEPGQAVTEGEILISGTMDSISNGSRYVCARGDVIARTGRLLYACEPTEQQIKHPDGIIRARYAVCFGKKRIDLFFNSGKTIDGCDKISYVWTLGVDGLFSLPLKFIREELRPYSVTSDRCPDTDRMRTKLGEILRDGTDGEIVRASFSRSEVSGLTVVTLRAQCTENIAKSVDIDYRSF